MNISHVRNGENPVIFVHAIAGVRFKVHFQNRHFRGKKRSSAERYFDVCSILAASRGVQGLALKSNFTSYTWRAARDPVHDKSGKGWGSAKTALDRGFSGLLKLDFNTNPRDGLGSTENRGFRSNGTERFANPRKRCFFLLQKHRTTTSSWTRTKLWRRTHSFVRSKHSFVF